MPGTNGFSYGTSPRLMPRHPTQTQVTSRLPARTGHSGKTRTPNAVSRKGLRCGEDDCAAHSVDPAASRPWHGAGRGIRRAGSASLSSFCNPWLACWAWGCPTGWRVLPSSRPGPVPRGAVAGPWRVPPDATPGGGGARPKVAVGPLMRWRGICLGAHCRSALLPRRIRGRRVPGRARARTCRAQGAFHRQGGQH